MTTKHLTAAALWTVFAGIFILYWLGVAAAAVIPFGPPISLAEVAHKIGFFGLLRADVWLLAHAAVLFGGAIPLLVYTFSPSRRLRIVVPLICLVGPLLLFAWSIKGLAQWLLLIPAAPYFTATALAGRQDGEFYAEGFLVYAALGWWVILCCALLLLELRFSKSGLWIFGAALLVVALHGFIVAPYMNILNALVAVAAVALMGLPLWQQRAHRSRNAV